MGKEYEEELKLRDDLIKSDNNKFVMAGAGAGKTYSLVKRIGEQIKRGEKTNSIVAISFTNKSAEDLREKIMESLDINSMSSEEKKKLSQKDIDIINNALKTIDEMHISTIHKFCGDILRENSIYSNVSPDFAMLTDSEDLSRKNGVFNAFFRTLKKDDFKIAFLLDIKVSSLSSEVKRIYDVLVGYVEKIEYDKIFKKGNIISYNEIEKAHNKRKECIYKYVEFVNDSALALLENSNKDDLIDLFKTDDKLFYFKDLSKEEFNKRYDELKDKKYEIKYDDKGTFKGYNPLSASAFKKKEQKEVFDEYVNDSIDYLKEIISYNDFLNVTYSNYTLDLAYRAYLLYLDYISKDYEYVSNDQLLVLTNELLDKVIDGNKTVADKIKEKYNHIYIDEYQDTDHIQRDIALKLTKNNNDFIDNSIFLVGDPKQSIYRFRGAEPEVYFDTRNMFNSNNCKKYDLNINFRSNSLILDYINDIYPNISLTGDTYQPMLYRDINEIKSEEISDSNLTGFYQVEGIKPENIAKLIKHLKKHYKIRRKNKDDKFYYDNINYSDIMVQMRNTDMADYVNEFTKEKIPSMVAGSSNFYYVKQVRAFANLFEAINSNGKKARQSAYDVFRTINKNLVGLNEEKSLNIAKNMYNKLISETIKMDAYGKAIYLAENLSWIVEDDSNMEAFEINSLKSKLYQIIEDVFTTNYANGSNIARCIKEYVNTKVDYESLIDDRADAVQVINIHKAKGLEKPIVIMVCNDKEKDKDNTVFYNDVLYIQGFYDSSDSIYNKLKTQDIMENARLEYVAATRPKEAFIFAYDLSIKRGTFKDEIYGIGTDKLRSIIVEDEEIEVDSKDEKDYIKENHSYNNGNPTLLVTSPSSLENNVSLLRNKLRKEAIESNTLTISNRPKGNILGAILHRSFELLVKHRDVNIDDILSFTLKENEDNIDNKKYEDYALFIKTCLISLDKYFKDNKIYDLALYPEFKFSCKTKDNEVSNGSIDLLVIDGKSVTIYDYKSDEADYIKDDLLFEETLKEKYNNQLNEYEKVVEVFGENISTINKKIIYFRRYDKENNTIDLKVCNL